MDLYFPKTRRPIVAPVKRPCPTLSPPTTPKHAKLTRPKEPPPLVKKKTQRSLFKEVVGSKPQLHHPLNLNDEEPITPKKLETKQQPQTDKTKIASGPLKGVSTSLLDLIRAKEAAAKETSPEEGRRRELLGIAPEIARIIPTVFTANKKEIMLYDKVVDKCFKGLKSNYTSATIVECIELMDKVAPEWLTTVTISRGKFMRINRDKYTLTQLLEAIKKYSTKRPR